MWVDPEVVAFVEVSGAEPHVTALQVDRTGQVQKRAEKPLPADLFNDTSALKNPSLVAKTLAGVEITRIPTSGLTLRLNLAAHPALKSRTADVQMW